jgi:hypothetical protein
VGTLKRNNMKMTLLAFHIQGASDMIVDDLNVELVLMCLNFMMVLVVDFAS